MTDTETVQPRQLRLDGGEDPCTPPRRRPRAASRPPLGRVSDTTPRLSGAEAERAAATVRDATLADLLASANPWDVDRVKAVTLAAARQDPAGEVSANTLRDLLEPHLHWLIAPTFNALSHQRGVLINTGRKVPSTSPRTKGHGITVYRLASVRSGAA
ncbi:MULTISPECIES: hypothetical protein [Streptomycetaceae]|uniref:Uncharacterized protein n=1 Tax=Streptantibioticus cattleyicolor (strain ATCC 35852 / DSM 46488 / JCM 4925 / NBRC 14057 / NRRL 8057) TaxID=1003195 RepID=F8JRY7_STREN|nr:MULTISPECIES: hypothetical protein [Streptomycetaceae]AEW92898.1 hypothetical protein SCATT_05270 [Streptantibioticus cattleyicolor NRRL 8057 = DSM 46488]MYS57648.1 hypothetical protein [Streptomyces sp. SID5468]CCB73254.1 protein of unknown function [Streptantibioticus cattleyicolor NRRL 8057 = DSM 46488]